jgi:hypothetical protein
MKKFQLMSHIRRGGFIKFGRGLVSIVKHGAHGLNHKMNQLKIKGGAVAIMMNPDHLAGGKIKQSKRIKPLKFLA